MSTPTHYTLLALVLPAAGLLAASLVPRRLLAPLMTLLAAILALGWATLVWPVLHGAPQHWSWSSFAQLGEWRFAYDELSALLVLVSQLLFALCTAFAGPVLRHMPLHSLSVRLHYAMLLLLQACIPLLLGSQHLLAFLIFWEIMTLSSFWLIMTDWDDADVRDAALKYLVQMHLGFLALAMSTRIAVDYSGHDDWSALSLALKSPLGPWLLLACLFGFGTKAGLVPLHGWSPESKMHAPAHISALLSGVLLSVGLWGIVKLLSLCHSHWLVLGSGLLVLGMLSAIFGIMQAAARRDIKRALAYSSVENAGIITMALGIAALGVGLHKPLLTGLGLAAAIFHLVNHALFKSLLFLGSGVIVYHTGLRDLEKMGGLVHRMPLTAGMFLLGSLAISGLPPFNGFLSEFTLYASFIEGLDGADIGRAVLLLAALVSLALSGGISMLAYARMFGLGFLGTPRSPLPDKMESNWALKVPMLVLAACITGLGLFPEIIISAIEGSVHLLRPEVQSLGLEEGDLGQILQSDARLGLLLLALVAGIWLLRAWRLKHVVQEAGPTWGCGYQGSIPKAQYTSHSYADSLLQLFRGSYQRVEHTPPAQLDPNDLFPSPKPFGVALEDKVEYWTFKRPIVLLAAWLGRLNWGYSGRTETYISLGMLFILVFLALTLLGWL